MEFGNITYLTDSAIAINQEPQIIERMAILAGKVALYNFKWRYVVLLMVTKLQSIGIERFLSEAGRPLYIKYGEFVPTHKLHVPHYILFLEDTATINNVLTWLMKVGYDNTGRFLVVCASSNHEDCDENDIFKTCLRLNLINIVLIRPSNADLTPVALSYWPVKPGICYDSIPIDLGLNWTCENRSCFDELYPDKLHDLHGCVMKVSTFEQHPFMYIRDDLPPTGMDGDILNLMVEALNATLEIVVPEQMGYGFYQNKNWTGSVGDAFNGRAHFSMCAAPLTFTKYGNFQISFPYNSFDIVWVTALPEAKPSWEKLLYPLTPDVRVLIFVVFVLIALTNSALKTRTWSRIRRALDIAPPKSCLLFYSWSIFLGNNVKNVPSRPELRIIVYLWVWFCFILRTLYQAMLVTSLKLQLFDERFETISDVMEAGRPFGGALTIKEYYSEDPLIYNNWVQVSLDDTYDILKGICEGSLNFALAINKASVLEYLMYHNGTKNLQILPHKILNSPAVLYFKKYQPLAYPTSQILVYLREGGFIDRPISDYMPHNNYYFLSGSYHPPAAPLRIQHFAGCLGMLIGGWILSCLFFILELFCAKYELVARRQLKTSIK